MNVLSESEDRTRGGVPWLVADVVLYLAAIALFIVGANVGDGPFAFIAIIVIFVAVVISASFYMVQPNKAAVLTLFGDYRGSDRTPGLRIANPLYLNRKMSLRVVRNARKKQPVILPF